MIAALLFFCLWSRRTSPAGFHTATLEQPQTPPLLGASTVCSLQQTPQRMPGEMVMAAPTRLLGRLFRLAASPPAAHCPSILPVYQRRTQRGWAAAASSAAGLDGGSGAAAATAAPAPAPAPAPAAAAAVDPLDVLDEGFDSGDDDGEALLVLPRKLGTEAVGASGTGAFQRLPMVSPSKELLDSALRRAQRTPYNKKLRNEAQKAKNRCGTRTGGWRGLWLQVMWLLVCRRPACAAVARRAVLRQPHAVHSLGACYILSLYRPPAHASSSALKRRAARALDTLMKELCMPLGAYIRGFPPPARLHPFEFALLELTVGPGTYERVLSRVEALRRSTVEVGCWMCWVCVGGMAGGENGAGKALHLCTADLLLPQLRPLRLLVAMGIAGRLLALVSFMSASLPARLPPPTARCRWARHTPRVPPVQPTRRTQWRCRRRALPACRQCSAAAATQVGGWQRAG